jgi:hypothetical protein
VQGDNLSVDGSFVEANANKGSRIPREQLAEAAQAKQTVRQYLLELEQQNPTEEPVHQQEQVFWAAAARKNCSRTNFILRKRKRRSPI